MVRRSVKAAGTCKRALTLGELCLLEDDFVVRSGEVPVSSLHGQKLVTLAYQKGSYTLVKSPLTPRIFHVVKHYRREFQEGYKLQAGDNIRFGGTEFAVRECCCGEQIQSRCYKELLATRSLGENEHCRICCSEENTEGNPLVSLCRCSGSIKFMHVSCIRMWYKSKTKVTRGKNTTSYSTKGFECELCKAKIPLTIQIGEVAVDLIELEKPLFGSYIVLESLSTTPKDLHVVYADFHRAFTVRLVCFAVT